MAKRKKIKLGASVLIRMTHHLKLDLELLAEADQTGSRALADYVRNVLKAHVESQADRLPVLRIEVPRTMEYREEFRIPKSRRLAGPQSLSQSKKKLRSRRKKRAQVLPQRKKSTK